MESEEKEHNYELAERLLKEQNFGVAIAAGMITMILGSGIYAVIALAAGGESVSIVFVGIGAAIGFAMQYLGRGITARYAAVASFLAFIGFPAAKFFTIALYTAKSAHVSPVELFGSERMAAMWSWVLSGLHLLDLIFGLPQLGQQHIARNVSCLVTRAWRFTLTGAGEHAVDEPL